MGLHRSGTSILYKMLGETGKFNILTTYHVYDYDRLIYNHIKKIEDERKKNLNDLFKSKGITNRKLDNIQVTADYAYEYVYIFSKKNFTEKINDSNSWLFEEFCKKISYISDNKKPILLKNPYDYANFLYIKKKYPNAKFIFINRNPLSTIDSNMRGWRTLMKEKNEYTAIFSKSYTKIFSNPLLLFLTRAFYSWTPFGLLKVIRTCSAGTKYFLKNKNLLSDGDFISIKYEDLCKEPNKIIGDILKFLDLNSDIDFTKFIKPRNLKFGSDVDFFKKYIYSKMKPYFEYFKYTFEK